MGYKIKLRKNSRNSYRIIVVKKKSSFRGRVLDYIGTYTYLKERNQVIVRVDKLILSKWLLKGAEVSERLHKVLRLK
jgi:ribosomal protein S16